VDPGERAALQDELTALARGDRTVFEPLFLRLWPLVRGFASRFLPREDAEDAAQEALVRVFARASEFDPARDALSWALGVAAWQIRTQRTRRRRRREEVTGELPELADEAPDPESLAMARARSEALDRALGALSPADAETLLSYARGERPDVEPATFRKRVQRALARVRSKLRTGDEL
jgi:RNA polymerase sigma-70 factor (ECF subfamily)